MSRNAFTNALVAFWPNARCPNRAKYFVGLARPGRPGRRCPGSRDQVEGVPRGKPQSVSDSLGHDDAAGSADARPTRYAVCISTVMPTTSDDTKTVLIADDDDWLREMLTCLLIDEGFCPLEARTGPETVLLACERQPDVILLDVALPGRSGLDVLEELRAASATRDIPVMLVSGEINIFETGHAYDANATFHKPLDFAAFLRKIHETTAGQTGPG